MLMKANFFLLFGPRPHIEDGDYTGECRYTYGRGQFFIDGRDVFNVDCSSSILCPVVAAIRTGTYAYTLVAAGHHGSRDEM